MSHTFSSWVSFSIINASVFTTPPASSDPWYLVLIDFCSLPSSFTFLSWVVPVKVPGFIYLITGLILADAPMQKCQKEVFLVKSS